MVSARSLIRIILDCLRIAANRHWLIKWTWVNYLRFFEQLYRFHLLQKLPVEVEQGNFVIVKEFQNVKQAQN